jgi:hypothetical protein
MSFDASRFSFHPWNDYFGVVMQQGRVQLDSDWNEWVAELGRRLQAGTMDTVGRAVVPRTTPEGFHILAAGGALSIGVGRMYVDGLLAENHGKPPLAWNADLAELSGSAPMPFLDQPYLPFNETNQPAPANIFDRPALSGGPHLVYLDVWQRELTHLQAPDLIEKAVGIDTTGRLQTVWQVKVLADIGNADCSTPDGELAAWAALVRPSGARLSNSTGAVTGEQNPCLAPPTAGYKGLENQLYRVEVHRGGPRASATFKWSRDNATVATGVQEIQGGHRLVVDSLGRDDVLGFHAGEWVEILDDWHELHGLPGRLHRIRPGDGVDAATRSIILETDLPAGLFPVDGQGRTDPDRHTRVRRWDQSGTVRRASGTVYHNLNASSVSDGIPVPAAGTKLALENGILIDFSLIAGGEFKSGDHWIFAARTSDGSIEPLVQAPPRGIHHHYARLAIVTLPDEETDCRVFWPPEVSGESCDCTVCVHAEAHNAGVATIQQAIDAVRARGGGTICLDVGTYLLRAPLNMSNVRSLRMRGQGWRTVLQPTVAGGAIDIVRGIGVTIENLSIAGIVEGRTTTAMIDIAHSVDLQLSHLTIAAAAATTTATTATAGSGAASAAIGLSGIILSASVRDCVLAAEQAVVATPGELNYLLTANLALTDNVLLCGERGISLDGVCLHYGQLRIADNLVLGCAQAGVFANGTALPAASVAIEGNVLHVSGQGIVAGTDQLRITDNEIVAMPGRLVGHGIQLVSGVDKGALDRVLVSDNRLRGLRGHGIAIVHRLGRATFRSNTVENSGGGALVMLPGASADYIAVESNQFVNIGVDFNSDTLPFAAVLLLATKRVDVTGNLLVNIARQAMISPLRIGVMTLATGEQRIAGNRLSGIGPSGSFSLRTVGIGIAPGFSDAVVDDNTVARIESASDKTSPANWQALLILGSIGQDTPSPAGMAAPGVVMLPTKSGLAYLTAGEITLLDGAPGSAMVRGNRMRSQDSPIPAAEILAVQGCLFDQNDIRVQSVTGDSGGELTGRVRCDHASIANNRLIGSKERGTFELFCDDRKFSVLGNLRTAPIQVNGTADDSLPPPWNALNITI